MIRPLAPRLIYVAALGLTLSLMLAVSAHAQPLIPTAVVTAPSAPSAGNQQVIVDYVQHWLAQLESQDHAICSNARTQLIDPMRNSNGSPAFKRAYSNEVSQRLGNAAASAEVHVRLNTAIVAAMLLDARAFTAIEPLISDDNPGVRYWAAKALGQVLDERITAEANPVVPPAQLGTLEQALSLAITTESDAAVLSEQIGAAVKLPGAAAKQALISALTKRVALRAADPELPVAPLLAGLPKLQQALATAPITQVEQPTREMALVAYRYLTLSTTVLQNGQAGEQAAAYAKLAEISNNMLRSAALQFGQNVPVGQQIVVELQSERWAAARRATLSGWRAALSAAPFNYSEADLAAVKLAGQ